MFSCYLFANPTSNQDAKAIAEVNINNMTKDAHLLATLISDRGTAFMSHVIKKVAGVRGITLKHATIKHAQTLGLLERSHESIKETLKIETGERSHQHGSLTCSLMRIRAQSNFTLNLPTPAAQKTIYVIIQSQIKMTITDIGSVPLPSTERICTLSGNLSNVLWK